MFLADTKHYVPIKPIAVTGNPRDFTENPTEKPDIHY